MNLNGRAAIAVGIGFAAGVTTLSWFQHQPAAMIVAILVAMLVDVWMRFRSEDCERPFIDPEAGATVCYAPVWFVGILLMILLALSELRVI